jgi:hypothetical protein
MVKTREVEGRRSMSAFVVAEEKKEQYIEILGLRGYEQQHCGLLDFSTV